MRTMPRAIVGVDAAQRQVGVGGRHFCAPDPVGDRAGYGAGTVRADVEPLEFVDPGNGAAPLADFDQIDDRHRHRIAT